MFVYSFIYFTITGCAFWSVATNTTAYLFYSNCVGSEEPAVDGFLQQSHFENFVVDPQAFSLVSETGRKFKAGHTCSTEVFLSGKKCFFSVSAAAASIPRWLTWKPWLSTCWPPKNKKIKRNLSNVFAIRTPVVLVQSQKLKRSWEFFIH